MRRFGIAITLGLFLMLSTSTILAGGEEGGQSNEELQAKVQQLESRVQALEALVLKLTGQAEPAAAPVQVAETPAVAPAAPAATQVASADKPKSTKISGLGFGDYYYVAKHHDPSIVDSNAFWFRRIYLTFDTPLSSSIDTRIRFEMNSPGDFRSDSRATPFVKDAWLRWKFAGNQQAIVGISPTPTFDAIEGIWGYRQLEKTPLDLQRWSSSREFGLAFRGDVGQSDKVNYHVMVANGNGEKGENDHGKRVLFALGYKPTKSTLLQFYTDYDVRTYSGNRYTFQGFLGHQADWGRFGVQYSRQTREGARNLNLDLVSIFSVVDVAPKVSLVGRWDRSFDPNPSGADIDYLPFDPRAKSNFFLVGLDYRVNSQFSLIPNMEIVKYDKLTDGTNLDSDIIPRLTFSYTF